jgi:RimJ/RimL family protein N-acetyltransferase
VLVLVCGACRSSDAALPEPVPTVSSAGAFTQGFAPPPPPITERVRLEALGPEHAELDPAAAPSSREHLQRTLRWGEWPSPDMTVEENRADLERHEAEYAAREAYAYTVLTPDGARCVGCVYVNPAGSDEAPGDPRHARIAFWVVEDELASDLDEHVVRTVLTWIDGRWPLDEVRFTVQRDDARTIALLGSLGLMQVVSSAPERLVFAWRRAAS